MRDDGGRSGSGSGSGSGGNEQDAGDVRVGGGVGGRGCGCGWCRGWGWRGAWWRGDVRVSVVGTLRLVPDVLRGTLPLLRFPGLRVRVRLRGGGGACGAIGGGVVDRDALLPRDVLLPRRGVVTCVSFLPRGGVVDRDTLLPSGGVLPRDVVVTFLDDARGGIDGPKFLTACEIFRLAALLLAISSSCATSPSKLFPVGALLLEAACA